MGNLRKALRGCVEELEGGNVVKEIDDLEKQLFKTPDYRKLNGRTSPFNLMRGAQGFPGI